MMHVEIDDYKCHLNHKNATENARRVRHVRDNRFGIVCHALAFISAVAFEFETQNYTTTTSVLRLIQNTHAPSGTELYANNVKHAMDRGYFHFKVMNQLTEDGSQVCSTVKRCPWFPCAYN